MQVENWKCQRWLDSQYLEKFLRVQEVEDRSQLEDNKKHNQLLLQNQEEDLHHQFLLHQLMNTMSFVVEANLEHHLQLKQEEMNLEIS